MTEGPLHLAEGPPTTDVVCLHLIRTHYNSPEGSTSLVECPMNYNSREHTLGTRESIIHDRESVKLNHHSFHYVPGLADCPIVAPDYLMTQTDSSIVLHSNT